MKIPLVVVLMCVLAVPSGAATLDIYRKHLTHPTEIQGYPCAKDYAWFFSDGHLNRCFLSRDTDIGKAHIPRGSIVELFQDGRLSYVMLNHDTVIGSVRCSGGGLLGPAEGAMTALYPSGQVRSCFLPADAAVQGVPCARATFWTAIMGHDEAVEFYEDGRLRSCGLAEDFGGQKKNMVWKSAAK
jgi:hypothetical protein